MWLKETGTGTYAIAELDESDLITLYELFELKREEYEKARVQALKNYKMGLTYNEVAQRTSEALGNTAYDPTEDVTFYWTEIGKIDTLLTQIRNTGCVS